jgi:DNA repair protein RadD
MTAPRRRSRAAVIASLRQDLADRDAQVNRLLRLQHAHRALLRHFECELEAEAREVERIQRAAGSMGRWRVGGERARAAALVDLADVHFRRDVEQLHRLGARAVFELLSELGRERLIRVDIERRVRRFAHLDPATVAALGADRLAPRPQLRDYQVDVIGRFGAEVAAGRRRILLVAPTGSGKTVIGGAIIEAAVTAGKRILFLAHRRELVAQASRKLHDVGVDHGIVQAGFPSRPGARVQVASIPTLHARAVRTYSMELPPAGLVVVDEAHHARARTYQRLIGAYPDETVLGLTATPCRGDGRGLGNIFEVLVECPSVAELTAAGYLVGTKVYAPSRPDLTGVQVTHGDYNETQLAQRMDVDHLVGDIVSHWLRLANRRRTVCFATGVAHSVHLRNEFRAAGVLAEHIDGSTPLEERDAILARLAGGTVEVVCNAMVLTEGFDCPPISCIILARPTKHMGLYRQMVGRVLRPAPGKVDALVLDHAGAVFTHGFVEEPVLWTLSEDHRAENPVQRSRGEYLAPKLVTCPECAAVRHEGKPCPACGWRPQPKPESVDVVDGELGEVDRQRRVNAQSYSAAEKLTFYR